MFHDLGSMEQRVQALPFALDVTLERTGVVALDDVQKRRYRRALRRELPARLLHYGYLDLGLLTRDAYGRYSAIVTEIARRPRAGDGKA